MQLFYTNTIQGNLLILNDQEAFHCAKVLRLKEGTEIHVTNGKGKLYKALISAIKKNEVVCDIKDVTESLPPDYNISIAIAPTKNIDRFEWFLEKSTELGVTSIIPITTFQSERKLLKPERLEKIVVAAGKQSNRLWFPYIRALTPLENLFETSGQTVGNRFIAHCQSNALPHLWHENKSTENLILIGPEGDFTTEEISFAKTHGCKEISLGTNRLRTETAGIAACHILALKNSI